MGRLTVYGASWDEARQFPPPSNVALDEYGYGALNKMSDWNGAQALFCRRQSTKTRVEDEHHNVWMPATVELLSAQPVEAAKAGELLSPAELSTRLYYDRIQPSTLLPTLRLLTDRFLGTQNFDPVARDPVVRVHQMMLTELAGQESYLIEVYRSTLQRLPDAANEQFVRSSRFSGND